MKHLSKIVLATLLIFGFNSVKAQDANNPWAIGIGVNAVDFYPVGEDAPLGSMFSEYFNTGDHWNILPAVSKLSVSRYIGAGFVAELSGTINEIEDYGDSHEFRIFGEEYLKMKHFLVPNSFLFVRATIQPGWMNKNTGIVGEPRLKFTEIKLLHDIMDELCKKITIKIPLEEIKENIILNLETILKNNPGKQTLHFTIWDAKEKIEVNLPSRNTKIHISNELLATLKSQQIDFKLN